MSVSRVFGLDVLRAAAIAAVLGYHGLHISRDVPAWLYAVLRHGWMGVDLFFVLSGYLIGSQALQGGSTFEFWIKRWTRTLPLYYLVLSLYYLKPYLTGLPFAQGSWLYLFFLQNTAPIRDFGQTWSLCIEEQFYLALPLLILAFKPKSAWFWLLPVLVSCVWRYWQAASLAGPTGVLALSDEDFVNHLRFPTPSMLDGLSFGVLLAATRQSWLGWSFKTKQACGALGCLLLLIPLSLPEFPTLAWQVVVLYLALAMAFALLLIAAVEWRLPHSMAWLFSYLALVSYGAYLWHCLFARLFERLHLGWHWSALYFAYLACTLATASASYWLVEKPGLKLRQILLRRRDAPSKIPRVQ